MLIVTNDTQTFNVPIFRSPFVDDTLAMRLHNKTTNEDVVIHPDSCEIHTTYVTITADLSNLYGGEWEYRLTNTDEDGYIIVSSQGTMYVNQLARFTDADGERVYTIQESVRGVCPPCPPTTTTHTISVTADEHATAIGGGTYEENTTASIGIVASKGYRFVSWNDGNVENPRQVVVDADKNYTAVVEEIPTYRVTATGAEGYTLVSVIGTGTFYEGASTTIGCNNERVGSIGIHYPYSSVLYRNGERVGDITLPYTIENIDANYNVELTIKGISAQSIVIELYEENRGRIGYIESNGIRHTHYYYDSDDVNWNRGVINAAKEGYRFIRWSDGNTNNPRAIGEDMMITPGKPETTLTAIMERVQDVNTKRVNIENNDAVEIFCPQREGTIGSVLPWRVRKTKPFTIVSFDAQYNQQYYEGGVDGYAIWTINNYRDGNPWQGLIMLSDDDDRNIIKYNVNQHSVDFGTTTQYTTGSETFVSIEGDADGVLYSYVYNKSFIDMFGSDVVSSMTNKFFDVVGFNFGVGYMYVSNANYDNRCVSPDAYFLSLKSNDSCFYGDDWADVVYYKNTGNELIVEFAKDNDGEHYNVVQWHIGINDNYVYCVLNNWTYNIDSVWWNNDYYKNNNAAFLGTDGVVKYCRDYGYSMPWDMRHESAQLGYVPTNGTKFGFTIQPNEPKTLDIEVAYSQKVTFYENFNNVCQPYSNNIEDFTVGDKYISETTGVNFYEYSGDRLPMVTQNVPYLSKYEVKSVMPDITMLQDDFMRDFRLLIYNWSWLFDKLPNIQTIENSVLSGAYIWSFEPTAGQWSNLTTIGSYFLYNSMVRRVDFSSLTNLTTLRSHLCYGCSNLEYVNISKLKDLTDYDNSSWFFSCPYLVDIVFDGTTDQYQNQLGSLGSFGYKSSCTLHVAPEHLQTYIDTYGSEWMSIVAIE